MSETLADAEAARLLELPLRELRAEWHRWHPDIQMPERLPRDLLVRMIVWKLQAQQLGTRSTASILSLDRLSAQLKKSGTLDIEREASVKVGTTLVREWRGRTYRVTSIEDGFQFDNRTYASLSEIARAITGTRWSGPRFFGLKQQRKSSAGDASCAT